MGKTPRTLRADGDRWRARLGERPRSPDLQLVLFFCDTTDQRPYRVAEVPRERLPDADALERLSEDELRELFARSHSMDVPRSFHVRPGPRPS